MNCPVCNKAGLPDYRLSATTCPQCNSDLKPYFLLSEISKSKSSKIKSFALLGMALIVCGLVVLFYYSTSESKKNDINNASLLQKSNDSIISLHASVSHLQTLISKNEKCISYIVKKGDNPSKLAAFFYNDWSKYKLIEDENNLHGNYMIFPGDTLRIKLN